MSELGQGTFYEGIETLRTRFRNVPEKALEGYYSTLRYRLSDAQYRASVKKLFAEARSFPRPIEFIESAPQDLADADFDIAARDPYWQRVSYVLRASKEGQLWRRVFAERREAARNAADAVAHGAQPVPELGDHSGPPFYFPRPTVEFVDHIDEVRVEWRDREDLRQMRPKSTMELARL